MKTMFRLIVLVLMMGGWILSALSLHVVMTPQRLVVLPKHELGIADTWVDTRHWKREDALQHPVLLERLLRAGRADVLTHVLGGGDGDDLTGRLAEALEEARRNKASTQPVLEQAAQFVRKIDWN
jgi:hypothetical protein